LAPYFAKSFARLSELPMVGDVRTAGLMAAVELVADKETKMPFAAELAMPWRVRAGCISRGVIVRGSADNVVVCPPLIVQREQVDLIVDTIAESIREAAAL